MIRRSAGRATNRRQKNSGREVCTPCRSNWEARIAAAIAAEHEFMIGRRPAFGEYGDKLVPEIEKKIAEEVGKLCAEMNLKRAGHDGKSCRCPEPAAGR